jgi:hypothetical protein
MVYELAQLGSTVLLVAKFTFVLVLLLILTLAAIPGCVRRRKR